MRSEDVPSTVSWPRSPVRGCCHALDCPGKVARGQGDWEVSVGPGALPSAIPHMDRASGTEGCAGHWVSCHVSTDTVTPGVFNESDHSTWGTPTAFSTFFHLKPVCRKRSLKPRAALREGMGTGLLRP